MSEIFNTNPFILEGGIHSYIEDEEYLNKTLNSYEKNIRKNDQLIYSLRKDNIIEDFNVDLIRGISENNYLLNILYDSLLKNMCGTRLNTHNEIQYLDSFKYLYRDWTYKHTPESEIYQIVNSIKQAIDNINYNKSLSVFLGAGMGRIVVELASLFDKVIAIDKSYSMIYWFKMLEKRSIIFNLLNLRNVIDQNYKVIKCNAYLKDSLKEEYSKVNYVLADSSHLPFKKNTVSNMFSIFFTDVLPLSILIKELIRVIKKNGVFIHFGPLSYHFKKINEMYSADELIKVFEYHNFELIYADNVKIRNFGVDGLITNNTYNNLLYIFQKK